MSAELKVGMEAKHYFDKFTFDTKTKITMCKSIRHIYEGNMGTNTLKASVVEHHNWGRTHIHYEHYQYDKDHAMSSSLLLLKRSLDVLLKHLSVGLTVVAFYVV